MLCGKILKIFQKLRRRLCKDSRTKRSCISKTSLSSLCMSRRKKNAHIEKGGAHISPDFCTVLSVRTDGYMYTYQYAYPAYSKLSSSHSLHLHHDRSAQPSNKCHSRQKVQTRSNDDGQVIRIKRDYAVK